MAKDLTICTIGFAGKTAEEFFRLLQQAGVHRVIDIRENRVGQLSGYAKHPDLEFFLQRIAGTSYVHEPLLTPSPEIRKAYRKTKDWPAYESAFLTLMRERGVPERFDARNFEGIIALLCSEPGPEKCHRRLVADSFAEFWQRQGRRVEVRHLVGEVGRPKGRKKKSSSAAP